MPLMLLMLMIHLVASTNPAVDCIVDEEECKITDNLVHTYFDVKSIKECMALCHNDFNCAAFNYFGPSSDFIPPSTCMLLSSCETKITRKDCVRGTTQDDDKCICSISYVGALGSTNIVDLVGDVDDEVACKKLCSTNYLCKVYTYHNNQTSGEANMCFLLTDSGLQDQVDACDNCVTGPARCEVGQECKVAVLTDGNTYQYIFAEQDMTPTLVSNEKNCYLEAQVFMVGGGGSSAGNGGGAGSGYIGSGSITMTGNSSVFEVLVGGSEEESMITRDGQVLLQAAPGDNESANGGAGYSGGGAYCYGCTGGDGGEDGSDGEDSSANDGGTGSGFDLGVLITKNFVLTPGKGGAADGNLGGGGGGFVVNGKKPSGKNAEDGEGYGGGAGYSGPGRPGCVLIEL